MVSLEWYRTFKAVYKHQNYSKAAEELFMSQPAVSNQMQMLEAAVGHKLFTRKSKGVMPTENAKFLNNLIIESLDTLEGVEARYSRNVKKEDKHYVLGISEHLYKSVLSNRITCQFKHLSIRFEASSDTLFDLVNEQRIDAAFVRKKVDTFDVLSQKIFSSPLVVVGHPELDISEFEIHKQAGDLEAMQHWLEHQTWLSHMSTNPHIKHFWMHCFQKKRPKVFTNYIIPNEYLMLQELTHTKGVCVTLLKNAESFLENETLKLLWQPESYPPKDYYLIAHKKQKVLFDMLLDSSVNCTKNPL